MNRIAASRYEAVDLTLIFFQNALTVGSFSLDWGSWLKDGPFFLLAIVNFDVDYFTPDCLRKYGVGTWTYGHSLLLQLLLPVVVILLPAAHYWTARAVLALRERLRAADPCALGAPSAARSRRPRAALLSVLSAARWVGIPDSREALEAHGDSIWALSTSFVNVVYHTLTLKSLEVFFCERLPDGSSFLVAAPYTPCWVGAHRAYIVLGTVGLLFYTVGLPVALYLLMEYARVHDLFNNRRFATRFGWLYRRYSNKRYNWELVLMARRGLLILIMVAARSLPSVQIFLASEVLTLAVAAHCYTQPFISRSLNQLEVISLVCLMGVLGTGVLFSDDQSRVLHSSWEEVVTGIACALLFGALVFVVGIVRANVRGEEASKKVERQMRKTIIDILDMHAPKLSSASWRPSLGAMESLERFLRKLSGSFVAATKLGGAQSGSRPSKSGNTNRILVADRSAASVGSEWEAHSLEDEGTDRRWEMLADYVKDAQLELHLTVDAEKTLKWLMSFRGALHRTRSLRINSRRAASRDLNQSLSKYVPRDMQLGVVRFWLVNHWMQDLLADTSAASFYSRSSYARFFGNLVSENPYLIDHFLSSNRQRLDRAKEFLNDLHASNLAHGHNGSMAQLICRIDRGPFLAWMMIAPRNNIQVVRKLLTSFRGEVSGRRMRSLPEARAETHEGASLATGQKASSLDSLILGFLPDPSRLGFTSKQINVSKETRETPLRQNSSVCIENDPIQPVEVSSNTIGPFSDDHERHRMRATSRFLKLESDKIQKINKEAIQELDFKSEIPTFLSELESLIQNDGPFANGI
uniref:Uncharacterized protein n=2 Tax=Tetraselmis sp. GSL018 TaxID=582737 RepID=A0A061R6Y8_9CHLO